MNLQMIPIGISLILGFLAIYFGGVTVLGKSVMQIGIGLLFLIFAGSFLTKDPKKNLLLTGGKIGFYFLLFLGVTAISMQYSLYFPDSLSFWMSLSVFYFAFLLLLNCLDSKQIPIFLDALLILTFLLACFGFFLELSKETQLFFIKKHVYHNRMTGTFVNPNHFASFLGFSIALFPYYWLTADAKRRKILSVALGVIGAAFFFTFSFGAWIAAILSGVFFVYQYKEVSKKDKRIPFYAILILAAIIFIGLIYWLGPKKYSFWQRYGLYQGFFNLFSADNFSFFKDPRLLLVGGGLNCFYYLFQGHYPFFDMTQFLHAHNEYIQLLIETGILGLGSFLLLASCVFQKIPLKKSESKKGKLLKLGIQSALIFFLCHAFFEFNFRIPANFLLFFIFLSFFAVLAKEKISTEDSQILKKQQHLKLWLFILLSMFVIALSFRNLVVENLLDNGQEYAALGNYEKGESLFLLAERLKRKDAKVNQVLGDYYLSRASEERKGKTLNKKYLQLALTEHKKVLWKNNSLPIFFIQAGWTLTYLGKAEMANKYFLAAIQKHPKFLTSFLERGKLYLYNGDFREAVQDFQLVFDKLELIPGQSRSEFVLEEMRQILKPYHGLRPIKDFWEKIQPTSKGK